MVVDVKGKRKWIAPLKFSAPKDDAPAPASAVVAVAGPSSPAPVKRYGLGALAGLGALWLLRKFWPEDVKARLPPTLLLGPALGLVGAIATGKPAASTASAGPAGLLPQPAKPAGKIVVIECRGGSDKGPDGASMNVAVEYRTLLFPLGGEKHSRPLV